VAYQNDLQPQNTNPTSQTFVRSQRSCPDMLGQENAFTNPWQSYT
jgi:hypothetical protein